ncbi:MAG: hypothetical protein JSS75_07165 [Bacteroidetes bacterium]|nr:hypothetical protein [Bacteroidota bacterium]
MNTETKPTPKFTTVTLAGHQYKIRSAYSGFYAAALKAALSKAARVHMSRMLEDDNGSGNRSAMIDDNRAFLYALYQITYLKPTDDGKTAMYYRDFIPEYLFRAIVSVLVTPVGNAPDPLTVVDELSEEEVALVRDFFIDTFEKPLPIGTPKTPSTEPSENNGQVVKESSNSTATESPEASKPSPIMSPNDTVITSDTSERQTDSRPSGS